MKLKKLSLALGTLALAGSCFAANAAAPQALQMKTPTFKHWLVRLRAIYVVPVASSSTITNIHGHVNHISNDVMPEVDFSYFFTKHLATELILGTTRSDIRAKGTSVDTNGELDLGDVWLLPPTLTLQWHFLPNSKIDPYVGAGLNYTIFYNAKHGPTATKVHYSNSFGPALQAGVDYNLNSRWSINFDVKKIWMKTHANIHAGALDVKSDVTINPWIFGAGVGYRF